MLVWLLSLILFFKLRQRAARPYLRPGKRHPKPGERRWVLRRGNEGRNLWRVSSLAYIKDVDMARDSVTLIDDFEIQRLSLADFHRLYREAI